MGASAKKGVVRNRELPLDSETLSGNPGYGFWKAGTQLGIDARGPSRDTWIGWTNERGTKEPMKVAIQGERGSFSHAAAERMLAGCTVVPCALSAEVFDRVGSGAVSAAVIPIENSLAGPVAVHYDLLLERPVFVQKEFRLRIQHNLIAMPGVRMAQVRRVFSHPVALEQCRNFFRRHPRIQAMQFYDTAGSVKMLMEQRPADAAAIASAAAAEIYGANILKRSIEDDRENYTRFFLLEKRKASRRRSQADIGSWRTTMITPLRAPTIP